MAKGVAMERLQKAQIIKDLSQKMVFLAGPRQVGKTWLARDISSGFSRTVYLNWDSLQDRKLIQGEGWMRSTELLILDEIHKMEGWKGYLKGVFDTRPAGMKILVTGSARLDFVRQTGESLAGRFFLHRLLPLAPSELVGTAFATDTDRLMRRGGFPEPFLSADDQEAQRWRRSFVDGMIREDVLDLERIRDLRAMQLVLELLRSRVGAPVSFQSLSEDTGVSPNTVKKYVDILEALYVIFPVRPWADSVARSLLKNPKIYFYDNGLVLGDEGAVFENLVACCLQKHVYSRADASGGDHRLHYIRTKDGREVDFCLVQDGRPRLLVEAKAGDTDFGRQLTLFSKSLNVPGVQVVKDLKHERRSGMLELRLAHSWLAGL